LLRDLAEVVDEPDSGVSLKRVLEVKNTFCLAKGRLNINEKPKRS
jgi:hypothetical protein